MEVFKLLGTIAINNSDAIDGMEETGDKAKQLQSVMSTAFGKIGSFAVEAGKTIAKGLAVGTAAFGALVKSSVQNYAEYEQLVGGVETLFKDSSNAVMKYANDAYKTAGLSANEYMSTVTSFSASLLQGLGGDTEKAAKIADLAITDMSDNANKMGTSMEMIQNAYQGFAKQNYTMLDNLKLGYGGTAEEMARLINDSGVLGKKMTVTAKTLNQVSFDQMIEAIHTVQTEMGITGTTALEASETISGSVSAMGSAWENLLIGISDNSQDLDRLITNFTASASTVLTNLTNRIPSIIAGVKSLVEKITPELGKMLQQLLPGLIEGAMVLLSGLASAMPQIAKTLFDQVAFIGTQIAEILAKIDFKAVGEKIGDMFTDLVKDMPDILRKVGNAISDAWTKIVWPLIQGLFKAVFGVELPDWNTITKAISNGWNNVIWPKIQGFFKQTFGVELPSWTELQDSIKALWAKVKNAISNLFTAVFGIEMPSWNDLVAGIKSGWTNNVWPKIQNFFKQTFGVELPSWSELHASIKALWTKVQNAIANLFTAIFGVEMPSWNELVTSIKSGWTNNVWPKIQNFFMQTFGIELPDWNTVWTSIKTWWANVTGSFGKLFSAIFSIFTEDSDGTTVGERISNWWKKVTLAVGDVFFAIFGVDPEDQSTVSGRIATWWRSVVEAVGDVFKAVFSILTQDSDGKSVAGRIRVWWSNVLTAVGDVFKKIFFVNTQDNDGKIASGIIGTWWRNVLTAVGDVFKTIFNVLTDDSDGQTTSQKIASWWGEVMEKLSGLFSALFSLDLPSVSKIKESIIAWWNRVKEGLGLSVTYTVNKTEVTTKKTVTVEEAKSSGASQKDIMLGIASGLVSAGSAVSSTFTSKSGTTHSGGEARAFATGAVFKKPTIFSASDGWKMVGEAGAEAIAPIDVLQGYVTQAVANQNAGLVAALEKLNQNICEAIYTLDDNMGGNMRAALEDTKLSVNNREFARLVKAVN